MTFFVDYTKNGRKIFLHEIDQAKTKKLRHGKLSKCTICRKCDFTEIGVQVIDPFVIVWWKCNICTSVWSEEFRATGHKLEENGRT